MYRVGAQSRSPWIPFTSFVRFMPWPGLCCSRIILVSFFRGPWALEPLPAPPKPEVAAVWAFPGPTHPGACIQGLAVGGGTKPRYPSSSLFRAPTGSVWGRLLLHALPSQVPPGAPTQHDWHWNAAILGLGLSLPRMMGTQR